jgi:hypothetical protein
MSSSLRAHPHDIPALFSDLGSDTLLPHRSALFNMQITTITHRLRNDNLPRKELATGRLTDNHFLAQRATPNLSLQTRQTSVLTTQTISPTFEVNKSASEQSSIHVCD